ncbi:LPXTG cell wall anchor domain-containing protein [Streptomyces sp. NBC_00243]|uniref:LPXTG cell wall anchor domain-containing protein n=1 Tax=Streptomyces sp. NBC_00243 TaxID=2975688 RepID=UPI002DDA4A4A|nr:LPXTG cell wall anchor domain-containing protein [Streptomyces sp. NBC_00243]WRZ20158.1 LPXTG cell wall anchor domain-containing protein [Streptomyces sp. NBC_00243]
MSAARRSLLTATAAGTLLGALWFVPSANATQDEPVQHVSTSTSASPSPSAGSSTTTVDGTTAESSDSGGDQAQLADTGSVNTTPYVIGGTLFLGLGAGFVTYSVRRERTVAY